YFILIPNDFERHQKLALLSLIFVTTYLIPLFILVLFKKWKLIKSYNTESIKERKMPVVIMIVLFYLLGKTLPNINNLTDLGFLFYAISGALIVVYLLFYFQIKASIHLLSLGALSGFFIVMSFLYTQNFYLIIIINILLAGLLATARLHLKAHTQREVYLGFFIGFLAPFCVFFLQYIKD
ncbi:MAG: hypothetical protein ACWIPI_01335, partial [Polaribacter sp.]